MVLRKGPLVLSTPARIMARQAGKSKMQSNQRAKSSPRPRGTQLLVLARAHSLWSDPFWPLSVWGCKAPVLVGGVEIDPSFSLPGDPGALVWKGQLRTASSCFSIPIGSQPWLHPGVTEELVNIPNAQADDTGIRGEPQASSTPRQL